MDNLNNFKNSLITKTVSIITVFAFCFTMVLNDAWAVVASNQAINTSQILQQNQYEHLNVKDFVIPEKLGIVKDVYKGKTNKVVVHIQDAHCNYGAQHKIAEIIDYVNSKYGVDIVNLEGGKGNYDLSVFSDIENKDVRSKISDQFVYEGLINGAEYFAVNNPDAVKLWGVEKSKLYFKNLNAYRDSLKYKEKAQKYLGELKSILKKFKKCLYSSELIELDTKYIQYKKEEIDFKEYLLYLVSQAKKHAPDMVMFLNIKLLSESLELEKTINFKRANTERDQLIDKLQKFISEVELKELVIKTLKFKQEQISPKEFYTYLATKSKALYPNLNRFPELQKYMNYVFVYETVDKAEAMKEIRRFEKRLKEVLRENDKQKELEELSVNLDLMENMFDIKLTREDYELYRGNKKAFNVGNYISFINKEAVDNEISVKLDDGISILDEQRERMADFYEYSFKRDKVFLKSMRVKKLGRGIKTTKSAILVTGGFHTDNLCKLFKEKGISYVSIMPEFINENGYESPYFKLLGGEKSPLRKRTDTNTSDIAYHAVCSELKIPDVMSAGDDGNSFLSTGGLQNVISQEVLRELVKILKILLETKKTHTIKTVNGTIKYSLDPLNENSRIVCGVNGGLEIYATVIKKGKRPVADDDIPSAWIGQEEDADLGMRANVPGKITLEDRETPVMEDPQPRLSELKLTVGDYLRYVYRMLRYDSYNMPDDVTFWKTGIPGLLYKLRVFVNPERYENLADADGVKEDKQPSAENNLERYVCFMLAGIMSIIAFVWTSWASGNFTVIGGGLPIVAVGIIGSVLFASLAVWSLPLPERFNTLSKLLLAIPIIGFIVWKSSVFYNATFLREDLNALKSAGVAELVIKDEKEIFDPNGKLSEMLKRGNYYAELIKELENPDEEKRLEALNDFDIRMIVDKRSSPFLLLALTRPGLGGIFDPNKAVKNKARRVLMQYIGEDKFNSLMKKLGETVFTEESEEVPTLDKLEAKVDVEVQDDGRVNIFWDLSDMSDPVKNAELGMPLIHPSFPDLLEQVVFAKLGLRHNFSGRYLDMLKGKVEVVLKRVDDLAKVLDETYLYHVRFTYTDIARKKLKCACVGVAIPAGVKTITVGVDPTTIDEKTMMYEQGFDISRVVRVYVEVVPAGGLQAPIDKQLEILHIKIEGENERAKWSADISEDAGAGTGSDASVPEPPLGVSEKYTPDEVIISDTGAMQFDSPDEVDMGDPNKEEIEVEPALLSGTEPLDGGAPIEMETVLSSEDISIDSILTPENTYAKLLDSNKEVCLEGLGNLFMLAAAGEISPDEAMEAIKETMKDNSDYDIHLAALQVMESLAKAEIISDKTLVTTLVKDNIGINASGAVQRSASEMMTKALTRISSSATNAMGKYTEIEQIRVEDGELKGIILNNDTQKRINLAEEKQEPILNVTEFVEKFVGEFNSFLSDKVKASEKEQEIFNLVFKVVKDNMPKHIIFTSAGVGGYFGKAKKEGRFITIDETLYQEKPESFIHELIEYALLFDHTLLEEMEKYMGKPAPLSEDEQTRKVREKYSGTAWLAQKSLQYLGQDYFNDNYSHYVICAFTRQVLKEQYTDITRMIKAIHTYESAKAVVSEITKHEKHAHTYAIEPASSEETISDVEVYLRNTERKLRGKGFVGYIRGYLANDKWEEKVIEKFNTLSESFYDDLMDNPEGANYTTNKTRMVVRLIDRSEEVDVFNRNKIEKAIIFKFVEMMDKDSRFDKTREERKVEIARDILNTKIRFVTANIGNVNHLNTVIDLITDLTMVECDRYGKIDGYNDQPAPPQELQDRFLQLLQLSVTNYRDLIKDFHDANTNAVDIARLIKNIFQGKGILMIRPIDWTKLPEWKKAQDMIVMSV